MKYLGGKHRIRDFVRETILGRTSSRGRYVEPFVGSAAVWMELAPLFGVASGSDAMPDLVLYLNAVRGGWLPPWRVREREYYALFDAPSSAIRGHVGFNCSWGGMWFRGWGGYDGRDMEGRRTAMRDAPRLRCCPPVALRDYREVQVGMGDVVYCDPPYGDTEPYRWLGKPFDTYEFWSRMPGWVRDGARVLVSEERAPQNWVPVAMCRRKALAAYRAGDGRLDRNRVELIFMHESQVEDKLTLASHRASVRSGVISWPAIE